MTDSRQSWLIIVAWSGVIISALAVVYVSHNCRNLYAELVILERHSSELQVEWGQLLLEESTLASFARIERRAVEKLNMHAPSPAEIVVVRQ